MTRVAFTNQEIDYITDNALTTPVRVMAIYLNRSINSVKKKIQRLNIPKLDEAAMIKLRRLEVKKQAKIIKAITPISKDSLYEHTFTEIALMLGISEEEVDALYASGISKVSRYLIDNPDVADEWAMLIYHDSRYDEWDMKV